MNGNPDSKSKDGDVKIPLNPKSGPVDKKKDDLIKYMSNGNKTKLMTSGLLNTAALSTNASLLALIMKLERMNATASVSLCLIIISVSLQLMTAIFTLLEYRATLIVDRDPEKLLQERTRTMKIKEDGTNGKEKAKSAEGTGKKAKLAAESGTASESTTNGGNRNESDKTYFFCKPMELQFAVALCTVILTTVNTFIIALTSNIREDLEIPAGYIPAGTVNYQNNA